MGVASTPLREPDVASASRIGTHALIDFYGVSPALLTDADFMGRCLLDAAARAGATPLSAPVLHNFPGGGLTGFLPLAESHLAVHTYPERCYLAADVFTCGSCSTDAAVDLLRDRLRPAREVVRRVSRGDGEGPGVGSGGRGDGERAVG